jgi:gluconolactonase
MKGLSPESFTRAGEGVTRPEDVAVAPDGSVWVSDQGSAAARIDRGRTEPTGKAGGEPNGMNFLPSGELLIANFQGPVQVLDTTTGEVRPFVEEVEGRPLVHANYVLADRDGFVWASDSTRFPEPGPDEMAQMLTSPDGWVFVRRPDGSTDVVADGLCFANGLCLSPDGTWLYMAETLTGTISRARIRRGGTLGERETFYVFEPDGAEAESMGLPGPDGCGFDAAGNLWVALWNRRALAVVAPDRTVSIAVQDPSGDALDWPTNVVWGGPDRRTLYVGSIVHTYVSVATVETPGAPQPWETATAASG